MHLKYWTEKKLCYYLKVIHSFIVIDIYILHLFHCKNITKKHLGFYLALL